MSFRARVDLRHLLAELRRRKVVRVAVAYAVAGWVTIEVSATVLPHLGVPGAAVTVIIIMVAAGFPLALVLSWAYDLKPDEHGWAPSPPPPSVPLQAGVPSTTPELSQPAHYRLPVPPHRLVGREAEMERLISMLGTNRLVTVVGPGGVGKTRLALEAGGELQAAYEQGACFVPLAGIASLEPLIPALALRLRLPPGSSEDPRGRIVDFLREKEMLLLLDNFEHLTGDSTFLVELLEAAPAIRLLVTSRERLHLAAETLFPLHPLSVDPPVDGSSPAEEMFLQAAHRLDPAYDPGPEGAAAIRRICQRLDGIPLALELAAAGLGSLTESEIEHEIERSHDFLQTAYRDIPERHRSMRAAFESSWKLLGAGEQKVFAELSVFRGGFDRRAAGRVAGATPTLLAGLQGKSLLRQAPDIRYEILEVLRQFAQEKLEMDAEEAAATRQRHAEHFAELCSTGGATAQPASGGTLTLMEEEVHNLREAWLTAVREGRNDLLHRMLDPLFEFHHQRGWGRAGEEILERAVRSLRAQEPTAHEILGPLCTRLGILRHQLGRTDEARAALHEGVTSAVQVGDALERAVALDSLGQIALASGEYEEARAHFAAAMDAAEGAGDARIRGRSLAGLGIIAWTLGELTEARRLFGEAIPLLRAADSVGRTTGALRNLGVVEAAEGNTAAAERLFGEALDMDRAAGNQRGTAFALQHLAVLANECGDVDRAEGHLDEAIPLARESGNRFLLAYCLNLRGVLALQAGEHRRARSLFSPALRIAVEIGARPLALEVLTGYARMISEEDAAVPRAVEMLAAIRAHPAIDQIGRKESQDVLETLRGRIDAEEFAAAEARGKAGDALAACEELLAGESAASAAAR